MNISEFNYDNKEITQIGGAKVVRTVSIRNGKGYKRVTKFRNNKKMGTFKKGLNKSQVQLIQLGKFIPGLFNDCKLEENTRRTRCKKSRRRLV